MPKLIRATMIRSVCLGDWEEVLTWHFSPLNSGIFCSRLIFPYSTIVLPFDGILPLSPSTLVFILFLFKDCSQEGIKNSLVIPVTTTLFSF